MADLQTVQLNLHKIVDDLRSAWSDRTDAYLNRHAFSKARTVGDHIMFCCPYHSEANPSFGIRTCYPYVFHCFGCGISGKLSKLIAETFRLPSEAHAARYILRRYFDSNRASRPPLIAEHILDGRQTNRERSLTERETVRFTKQFHPYMTVERGLHAETLRAYEVGFDKSSQSVTFPVRTRQGLLRFIKRRSVHRKSFLNERQVIKKDIVYGLWHILNSPLPIKRIRITESEIDAMSCFQTGYAAGALLGKQMFKEQVFELMKAGIDTIDLFLDNDPFGVHAGLKAYKLVSAISPIRINMVLYPSGHWGIDSTHPETDMPFKDANDLLLAGMLDQTTVVSFEKFVQMLKVTERELDDYFRRKK
ncbi:CHC2 zinc finger domain-containing protein [Paenibacillus sp. NPDC058071]|uniref:CHC2 zinc finger domain-containing protein n=1 Tax=Paenibacillus sp. NPDC058071 TaxID=3346326 RepID=UPI0036DECF09